MLTPVLCLTLLGQVVYDYEGPMSGWPRFTSCVANANCTQLLTRELHRNYQARITGTIPQELYTLTNLEELGQSMELTGTLSTEIGLLTRLTSLELYRSNLSGQMPSELGALVQLTTLGLRGQAWTSGSIPTELGLLTVLVNLDVSDRDMTATLPRHPIPAELGSLTALTYLRLSNSRFTGSIPSQLGRLRNLAFLYLEGNDFEGTKIPTEVGRLTELYCLGLTDNSLDGRIPKELCNVQGIRKAEDESCFYYSDGNDFKGDWPTAAECSSDDSSNATSNADARDLGGRGRSSRSDDVTQELAIFIVCTVFASFSCAALCVVFAIVRGRAVADAVRRRSSAMSSSGKALVEVKSVSPA
mmetsp:Transcript_839/g.2321  ORF Transcript_839/g.2321 Transcript_839/m.2321 type:complete len:358 (-) Transcript_839:249-1322(-)